MIRRTGHTLITAMVAAAVLSSACGTEARTAAAEPAVEPIAVSTGADESRAIERYLRVTGSLVADAQAEVSAETAGGVEATPVERGTSVTTGTELVRISAAENSAQLQEAEANAAQIEARLGLTPGQAFDPRRVPEVGSAQAALDLAEAEFARIRSRCSRLSSQDSRSTSSPRSACSSCSAW